VSIDDSGAVRTIRDVQAIVQAAVDLQLRDRTDAEAHPNVPMRQRFPVNPRLDRTSVGEVEGRFHEHVADRHGLGVFGHQRARLGERRNADAQGGHERAAR
jgi:hypothetical protein